jgi:serine/threonine-protein kinase HipA
VARIPVLDVWLNETLVGTIANNVGDVNHFAFDEAYRTNADAPVVSFKAFRDGKGEYRRSIRATQTRLHPYFANLLPEGRLREYLSQRAGVKAMREFPLIWLLGRDLPGALIVTDPEGQRNPSEVSPQREPPTAGPRDVLRFSLAGIQLKFSASGDPTRGLTIPVDGMGGHWILKLPDQRFKGVPENEFSMMTFARSVGLEVPEIGLVEPADVAGLPSDVRNLSGQAFYIKRFDRLPSGGRVHTEDFAQANLIYPESKYRHFNFDLLAEQVVRQTGTEGGLELIRRLVFTAGIGNGDMHSKNWSFIYRDGRTPQLAPAYDYISTIVYMPDDDLGMNLLGSRSFDDFDEARLRALAKRARLPTKPVLEAAYEMVDRMLGTWPRIAMDLPLDAGDRELITKHMVRPPLFRPRVGRPTPPAGRRSLRRSSRPT